MLGQATGLHKSQAGQMLMSLAPVVMGMLGRQKKVNNLDQKSLADLVTRGTQNFNRQSPTNTSLITKFLDKDGDGSAMDEIMSMGAKRFSEVSLKGKIHGSGQKFGCDNIEAKIMTGVVVWLFLINT